MRLSTAIVAVFLGLATAAPAPNPDENTCLLKLRSDFIPAVHGCGVYDKRDENEDACLLKARGTLLSGCGYYGKRDENTCLLKLRDEFIPAVRGCGVYTKRDEGEDACLLKARGTLLSGCGYYG